MIAPARLAAFDVLMVVERGTVSLPSALAAVRDRLEDERDHALLAEITNGTLRWQGQIDHVIACLSSRPCERLDVEILLILRLSVYQLMHLDRVPPAAVVHDAVQLARRAGKTSAAGLVNGVLRAWQRRAGDLALPPRPPSTTRPPREQALDFLSITLSHPRWLAARWLDRYGFDDAVHWAEFNNQPAPLTLRVNRLILNRDELIARLAETGVEATPTRFAPDGVHVRKGNPLAGPLADDGLFVPQDEASQLVARLVDAQPGERVIDLCAAPGGKTTALVSAMADRGLLVALDVRHSRVRLLARTIRRVGATSVRIVCADARRTLPFSAVFDRALLDAPCTGLGTIRREPEVRWRRHEPDLGEFSATQIDMLDRASVLIGPRGRLVYSTCSSEPEENEQVVAAFLESHATFRRLDATDATPDLEPVVDRDGYLRTSPSAHGLEAFFGAVLVRQS